MKIRKHHNNDGRRQIQNGKTWEQIKKIAKKLNIPWKKGTQPSPLINPKSTEMLSQ